jgi:ribonuclease PH
METKSRKQAQVLINQLGISVQDFCAQIGGSSSTENLDNEIVSAVTTIIDEVQPWFESPQGAWVWFTSSQIKGFGGMSPSEVVRQHGKAGAESILAYVSSKNLGGFE